jgi:hypothetical protein
VPASSAGVCRDRANWESGCRLNRSWRPVADQRCADNKGAATTVDRHGTGCDGRVRRRRLARRPLRLDHECRRACCRLDTIPRISGVFGPRSRRGCWESGCCRIPARGSRSCRCDFRSPLRQSSRRPAYGTPRGIRHLDPLGPIDPLIGAKVIVFLDTNTVAPIAIDRLEHDGRRGVDAGGSVPGTGVPVRL